MHWGYFSRLLKPVAVIDSEDFITIEALSHHSYDDYERMIKGESGAESVFLWTREHKNVDRRGAGPVDFGVTQIVDGNWGIHAIIRKDIFTGADAV